MSSEYPNDLRYTQDHEWARVEGKVVTVGITRFAVDQLGDITKVELPREGETVERGAAFGTVESVQASSDLFAPVSGKVVKINDPLRDSPEYVNEDCYDEGWLLQIELGPKGKAEVEELLSAKDYEDFLREEG